MGRIRPRGRPASDNDHSAGTGPRADFPGKPDRARDAAGREQQIVEALAQLREQLLAVPLGPSDGFRGNLRERLTTSPGSPPASRGGRPHR